MQDIPIESVLKHFISMKKDSTIVNIYSKFIFLKYQCNKNINSKKYLFYYFKKYKFITYRHDEKSDNASTIVDAVFCCEKKCIIIEQINITLLNEIIMELKKQQILIINLNSEGSNNLEKDQIRDEISNFKKHFPEILKNDFIKKTIDSISCYMIRRYFCPTRYFEDPSFFIFNETLDRQEQEMKLSFYSQKKSEIESKIDALKAKNDESIDRPNFQKSDFIELRKIINKPEINLVFHLKTFHVLVMKCIPMNYIDQDARKSLDHEIYFLKNYSHRCFTKFYGFLKDLNRQSHNDNIVGFIYEFMPNGTLQSFVENHKENEIDYIFLLMTLLRLVEAMEYLNSKSLIHRDLKPSNILLDHDYIPYISDFETIRPFDNEYNDISEYTEMTRDLGSNNFSSPEQYYGKYLTSSSDIYSFGKILYYLCEKKCIPIPTLSNEYSSNIRDIYNECLQYEPEKRMKIFEIKSKINSEIKQFNLFSYFEQYLPNEKRGIELKNRNMFDYESCVTQFCIEYIMHIFKTIGKEEPSKSISILFNFYSLLYFHLGAIYCDDINDQSDFIKAKKYYELAVEFNNVDALVQLGNLYKKGYGVEKDYNEAKKYYELAANANNSDAFVQLGNLYRKGRVENLYQEDYMKKAKEYYELASKQNNPQALYYLGRMYSNGFGVEKDYNKAKEYYEIAAKQKNSNALNNLGNMYKNGTGVEQDYTKAKDYYELAAELKNHYALNSLGDFYRFGYGVKVDNEKAKKYYESSGNTYALVNLGIMYKDGECGPKDIPRAIYYFEQGIKKDPKNSYAYLHLGVCYMDEYEKEKEKENYEKAKENYEKAAELKNPVAMRLLGDMYKNGPEKDYQQAKKYYESASHLNSLYARLSLGDIYRKGLGVEQNFAEAKKYYELSLENKNPKALFYLGTFFSSGIFFPIDYYKAIYYFTECSEFVSKYINIYNPIDKHNLPYPHRNDYYRYLSYNDLGLIYLLSLDQDHYNYDYAIKNIKESALSEYPFGQNNFGLLNEFYLNNIKTAEYLYMRSSKHNFALAEFNLGQMKEKDNDICGSIEFYIKASQHENEELKFRENRCIDERLEISKAFIICFTNLKLFCHFLSTFECQKAKTYFIKAFNEPAHKKYNYKFECKGNIFAYLKQYIFFSPLFNLENQPYSHITEYIEKLRTEMQIIANQNTNEQTFTSPEKLFKFIQQKKFLQKMLIAINDILRDMENLIYTPPYPILFGRLFTRESIPYFQKEKQKKLLKEINDLFYEGLGEANNQI